MDRTRTTMLVMAALAITVAVTPAMAQPPGPPVNRPAFSPYLNLLRGGNSPTLNYYGLVRPEQNARQAIQTIQSAVSANQRTIQELTTGGSLGQTGVPAQFQNHYGFFLNHRSGGGGAGGASGFGNVSAAGRR